MFVKHRNFSLETPGSALVSGEAGQPEMRRSGAPRLMAEATLDYITVSEPQAPKAQFTASPTSGLGPLPVHFTDQSSNAPTSWHWDFGDGSISTEQNPDHVYNTPGAFTVSLIATNASGFDTVTKPDYITVIEAKEKIYLPLVTRAAP